MNYYVFIDKMEGYPNEDRTFIKNMINTAHDAQITGWGEHGEIEIYVGRQTEQFILELEDEREGTFFTGTLEEYYEDQGIWTENRWDV